MKEPRMVTEVPWAAGEGLLIFSAGREQRAWVRSWGYDIIKICD